MLSVMHRSDTVDRLACLAGENGFSATLVQPILQRPAEGLDSLDTVVVNVTLSTKPSLLWAMLGTAPSST